MAIIDPEILKATQEGTTIIEVRDATGRLLGFKGRFLPHTYDNFGEALRENSKIDNLNRCKSKGLNEFGQTPEQEKEFKENAKRQKMAKEKADMALTAAANEMRR